MEVKHCTVALLDLHRHKEHIDPHRTQRLKKMYKKREDHRRIHAVRAEQNVSLHASGAQAIVLCHPIHLRAQFDKFPSVVIWTYLY